MLQTKEKNGLTYEDFHPAYNQLNPMPATNNGVVISFSPDFVSALTLQSQSRNRGFGGRWAAKDPLADTMGLIAEIAFAKTADLLPEIAFLKMVQPGQYDQGFDYQLGNLKMDVKSTRKQSESFSIRPPQKHRNKSNCLAFVTLFFNSLGGSTATVHGWSHKSDVRQYARPHRDGIFSIIHLATLRREQKLHPISMLSTEFSEGA